MCICLNPDHKNLQNELNDCQNKNIDLQKQIDDLENQLQEDTSAKPNWLDGSQIPYKPLCDVEGEQIALNPSDIYMECPTIRAIALPWRKLSLDDKLISIWKFVINALTYAYDKDDNWQPPIVTYIRQKGDCEDGTILFVTLARLALVPADSCFNACGYYHSGSNLYGHSYPIAKMSDGNWYIFESTLDSYPSSGPKIFKGSNYTADWGYANYKYSGKGPDQV